MYMDTSCKASSPDKFGAQHLRARNAQNLERIEKA